MLALTDALVEGGGGQGVMAWHTGRDDAGTEHDMVTTREARAGPSVMAGEERGRG